ncbi:MAG: hypothetical protein ABI151_03580 [Chitinophagaceae bacterium]
MMESSQKSNSFRNILCRLVFAAILCSLLYGFQSKVLVHQLQAPVLSFLYLDPIFWIADLTGLTRAVSSSFYIALAFDILLLASCVATTIFPSRRIFPTIFFLLYFLYFIIFNSYGAHHTLNKVGILLMPLAFIVRPSRFGYLWEGLRYYTLFIFTSAFIWKLVRLSWLHSIQGELILKKNLVAYLVYHPESFLSKMYFRLLDHPLILQLFFLAGFLLEGSFMIGFFTRKYDRLLLLGMFLLVAGFWFMADAFFGELLIFGLTLLPLKYLPSPSQNRA